MAYRDSLTSLANREWFQRRLNEATRDGACEPGTLTAVLMVDLDRFKSVNDTMGHSAGDALLREVAKRLVSCTRANDTVARFGGDEFAILMPNVPDRVALERVAHRINDRLAEPFVLEGKEVFMSGSIGIALHRIDSTEANDLIKYADLAMYQAKHSGQRRFAFYAARA